MPVAITVNPSIPNITVSDNPSLITPDLSNYVTRPSLSQITGGLEDKISISSGATINYINYISGELKNQIQVGGGGSGITSLNDLDGAIDLISSNDYFSFTDVGGNIDINEKPQNIIIYRNDDSQITGVQKNIDFIKIYRNINNKITGVYYNNYYKVILLDPDENITGVNVIYQ